MRRTLVAVAVALSLAGCFSPPGVETAEGDKVYVWHDDENDVTCWLYGDAWTSGKAISCLPNE